MSEIALVTARRARLARLAQDVTPPPRWRSTWRGPTRFLSTIQIGITSSGEDGKSKRPWESRTAEDEREVSEG